MRAGARTNSEPQLPASLAWRWAVPQPAPPQPHHPYPDSLLGSLTATCHYSAGSPHATEASQMGGAPDRHCGDCKVLRSTRESTQERGRGDTGCVQPLPPQHSFPQALPTPIRSPLPPTNQGLSHSSLGKCLPRSQLPGDWSTWRGLQKTPGLGPQRFEGKRE